MEYKVIFHKLWVIESLPDGELKTGRNLVNRHLTPAKLSQSNLKVAFEQPSTKSEFLNGLKKIKHEAGGGQFPMIHLECHGCEDGLAVASGKLIKWNGNPPINNAIQN